MDFWSVIKRYAGHEDDLTGKANILALSIASNQPFYPFTVYLALGHFLPASFWTLLSTPFFLAVPALSRRAPILGRTLLVVTGIGNTVLCLVMYGADSGVGLFLLPCIMIAALAFKHDERPIQLALIGLGLLAFIGLQGTLVRFTGLPASDDYHAMWTLHAYSVALLTALIGLMFSRPADIAK
jgi:hypothetical protein